LKAKLWRLGRRWKDDLNRDFIEFEGEMFGDFFVDGRVI